MGCDDCKEQVLELIEREAIDPEGVRRILDECPDCRAELERVKAMLAVAAELPQEVPPARVDAAILRAAEARGGVASVRRTSWRQPLAMAAVALLVVGVGVTAVSLVRGPRGEQLALAPPEDEAEESVLSPDTAKLAERQPAEAAVAEAKADMEAPREPRRLESGASRRAKKASARGGKKKEADEVARVALAEGGADSFGNVDAPAARASAPPAAAPAASDVALEEEAAADSDLQRDCERKVQRLERRRSKDADYLPAPEAQLEVGLCYRALGNQDEARRWLERAANHPSTRARAAEALKELE